MQPIEFFVGLALPSEDRNACLGDRTGGVVLGRENVATAPSDFGTQLKKRLDQDGGLDRHMQATGNAGTGQRLRLAILFAKRHQARHLVFGEVDFFASPFGKTLELFRGTI